MAVEVSTGPDEGHCDHAEHREEGEEELPELLLRLHPRAGPARAVTLLRDRVRQQQEQQQRPEVADAEQVIALPPRGAAQLLGEDRSERAESGDVHASNDYR
jgi:hypothetical protein